MEEEKEERNKKHGGKRKALMREVTGGAQLLTF